MEVQGTRGRCASGIPEEHPQIGEAPCVVASAGSKTIEGGPQRLMSRSPKYHELVCLLGASGGVARF